MNAIVSRASEITHAAPIAGPGDALGRCLAPLSQLRHEMPRAVKEASCPDICDRWLAWVEDPFRLSHKRRQRAVKLLEQLPASEHLAALQRSTMELLEHEAAPLELGVLVAVLQASVVDGDSEKAQTRAEMLPEVLRQHRDPLSAPVIAAAVLTWISRERFMPALSDFLRECADQRLAVRVNLIGIQRLQTLQTRLDAIIREIGDPCALPARA